MVADLSSAVSESMALAAEDLDPLDVNELLELICLAAIDAVRGAEYAGITLADRHGKLEQRRRRIRSFTGWTRCSTSSSRAPVSTRFKGGGRLDRMTCASMSVGRNTVRWRPSSGLCRRWALSCSMNLVDRWTESVRLDCRRFRRRHR